jgi:hypothetical protein
VPASNLTALLAPSAIPMTTLHDRYGALLELVRTLIGVVPNCDRYLEIWPPGFRTYNVMVPNLLNLPFALWGFGARVDVVGLAMYVSSRTAECAYCSAHTCSFALRRGAAPALVARALDDEAAASDAERAAIAVARSLSRVPGALPAAERAELLRRFSPGDAEAIVLGVAMMGFLNKFMDAIGVELEESTVAEVKALIAPSGWSTGKHMDAPPADGAAPPADTLGTKLSVLRHAPSALSLDRRWTAGVPKAWPAAGEFLRARTGHDFPLLGRLRSARARRAIAVMIRDNLDAATSVVGLGTKCLAGLIYATVIGDVGLADELRVVAAHVGVPSGTIEVAIAFARSNATPPPGDAALLAALLLARAIAPSPAAVTPAVVEAARALEPAAIVELVVFVSVLQLWHRLSLYYAAS